MSDILIKRQCRHIFVQGRQCNAHSLRNENFCYYHHTTRVPAPPPHPSRAMHDENFELPMPEDRAAIQYSLGEVIRRLAAGQIQHKTASLLFYGLSIASANLARAARYDVQSEQPTEPIIDVIIDPEEGILAPSGQPLGPDQKAIAPGRLFREKRIERERRMLEKLEELELHQAYFDRIPGTHFPRGGELQRLRSLFPQPPSPTPQPAIPSKLEPCPLHSSSSTLTAPSSTHASTSATPSTLPSSISENRNFPKPSSPATSAMERVC